MAFSDAGHKSGSDNTLTSIPLDPDPFQGENRNLLL